MMKSKSLITNRSGQQLLTESQMDPYPSIFAYSLQDFLRWWYIKMIIWHLRRLRRLSTVVDDQTSLSLLLKQFFTPWHRDYSLMGYLFGVLVKIAYLPIAFLIYLICMLAYLTIIILWLILPIGTIVFIITSLLR